jgi:hypothetical protein
MGGLFGGGHHTPSPAPTPVATPVVPQTNGAAAGVSQNYGSNNTLSNQSKIARGTFLGE